MTGLSWWLVSRASRLLEPDERDAVQGDFAELGTTGGRALRETLGLIARRQVSAWSDWHPWVGLVALVLPLGLVLSVVSRDWTGAIPAWFYVNNWTWSYLDSPGARLDLALSIWNVLLGYLTLMVWSWTAGFALGSLSRGAIWVNGALFGIIVFAGTLGSTTAGLLNPGNDAIFSLLFYRVALPIIVRVVLVVLPATSAMRAGLQLTPLSVRQAVVYVSIVGTLTLLTAKRFAVAVIFGWWSTSAAGPVIPGLWVWRGTWQLRLFSLVMSWPAAYLMARAVSQRWRHRPISA